MQISTCAITDEFHPNYSLALQYMSECGVNGVELRMLLDNNVLELSEDQLIGATKLAESFGMKVVSLATPIFKCALHGFEDLDPRFPVDQFGAVFSYDKQTDLIQRAFRAADITGARIIRVFGFLRLLNREACFRQAAETMSMLATFAQTEGVTIGVENEHCTNFATGGELARLIYDVNHPNLCAVWDPANAEAAGETAFPNGYYALPRGKIAHVHVKNCNMVGGQPKWSKLDRGQVNWPGQIAALVEDGYQGSVSLETHYKGLNPDTDPLGSKLRASEEMAADLKAMLTRW